jgi:predicted dinucleotide-binding enzyme
VKITVIGRGNVGGGLGRLWQQAGHEVTLLGSDGGDASDADVVLVAVPSGAIADALGKMSGVEGTPAIDATNAFGGRNEAFPSLAEEVKSITGGPVAKGFNLNYARLYDQIPGQRNRPSVLLCGDPEALELAEQLARDAGYDPVPAGGLENARVLEDSMQLFSAISGGPTGPFFYRIGAPGQL